MVCCIISDLERYMRKFNDIVNQMSNQMLYRSNIGDVSIDFCEYMIPCCRGVINLCQNVLQYTENDNLQEFCNNMIETQNGNINQLQEINDSTYGFVNTVNDINTYVSQYIFICRNMLCRMRNNKRKCVNLTFIFQMISCQNGISCMCENCLQCIIDPRLRTLCENMIRQSNDGIADLRQICCRIQNN